LLSLHESQREFRSPSIRGELYEVQDDHLAAIDSLESIGQPGNLRITIEIEPLEGGPVTSAAAYVKEQSLAAPAHSGFLDDYQDRRFIPPWDRR
jgi:gamma-glutamylaminecyclotransferase